MKVIKTDSKHSLPVQVFKEEEQHKLERVLSDFTEKNVQRFIFEAQMICMAVLGGFHDIADPTKYRKPSRTEHKDHFRVMRNQFARTREYLEEIAGETGPAFRPLYPSKISDILWTIEKANDIAQDPDYQINCKAVSLASTALKSLEDLEALFEENLDAAELGTINQEFAKRVAESYQKYLGEPTASINDPFPHLLKIIFEAVQINLKAPEKLAAKILLK